MATGERNFEPEPAGNKTHAAVAGVSSQVPGGVERAILREGTLQKLSSAVVLSPRTKRLLERVYVFLCAAVLGLGLSLTASESAFGFGGFRGGGGFGHFGGGGG